MSEQLWMILPRRQSDIGGDANLLSSAQAGAFYITHKAYTNDFEQSWHEHENASIDFVLGGGGVGTYRNRVIESSIGRVEFFRHEVRHNFRSGPTGIRSMHVVIPPRLIAEVPGLESVVVEGLEHTRAVGLAAQIFGELVDPDRYSGLGMESLSFELLGEIAGESGRLIGRRGWIRGVRDVLESVHDRPVSMTELCEASGVSRGHLARGFRAAMGMTAGEYHRRVRLALAASELVKTDVSIARIACGAGFTDQAHFSKAFKRYMGRSPGVYRRLIKS